MIRSSLYPAFAAGLAQVTPMDKSFLLLFFKKEALAFLPKHKQSEQALLF
jgi:hypothetical protein